jgi:hypothetical protein
VDDHSRPLDTATTRLQTVMRRQGTLLHACAETLQNSGTEAADTVGETRTLTELIKRTQDYLQSTLKRKRVSAEHTGRSELVAETDRDTTGAPTTCSRPAARKEPRTNQPAGKRVKLTSDGPAAAAPTSLTRTLSAAMKEPRSFTPVCWMCAVQTPSALLIAINMRRCYACGCKRCCGDSGTSRRCDVCWHGASHVIFDSVMNPLERFVPASDMTRRGTIRICHACVLTYQL